VSRLYQAMNAKRQPWNSSFFAHHISWWNYNGSPPAGVQR